jgi:hypothetical protein
VAPHERGAILQGYDATAYQLDFIHSGRVAEPIGQVMEKGTGHLLNLAGPGRWLKYGLGPQATTQQGERIANGRQRFGIPSVLTEAARTPGQVRVRSQRHEREESPQGGSRAQDRLVSPRALRLDTQMGPHFVDGHFQLPAQDEPRDDWPWLGIQISAESKA